MKKEEDSLCNMFLISLKRAIKSGWKSFRRQGGLSFATIFILILTISLVTSLFIFQKTSEFLVESLKEKVDMYVYFQEELTSDRIIEIRDELSKMPEVKEIVYISREEALERFTERHAGDEAIMESLYELGRNPLLASLNIKAWEATQYAAISSFLTNASFKDLIAKVDYQQKKSAIDKIFSITDSINRAGTIASIIFALVAVMVAFNTVRLAIYNRREEIETMRLVGASNWFIRAPFLVQGVIGGLLAVIVSLLTFGAGLYFLSPHLEFLIPGYNIFGYFMNNLWLIVLLQLAAGVGLGTLSSWIAIRRYLRA
jgi:cell division transport system permease protein